ncbi:MAG: hypothetical protein CMJ19_04600 [Phycisphaeraceae bacterium]|nr:hypothetical protein [Phycisphaeraceae bacterium]
MLLVLLLAGCMQAQTQRICAGVPEPGKTMLLVGQDVQSIDAYLKQVDPNPAGLMLYTDLRTLSGLQRPADDGAGQRHAAHFTQNPACDHMVFQLGLYLVDDLLNITSGKRDKQIVKLGQWINSVKRPVYLRIGYEFDGPWNHYQPDHYIHAYRHIVDIMRRQPVTNVAYVWASAAVPTYQSHPIDAWYPGDDYVDWIGLSVFQQPAGTLGTMDDIHRLCQFAQAKKRPIGIMESTPYGSIGGIADRQWDQWFKPVFKLIEQYDIAMFCYINANWQSQRMWTNQGWGDSRLQGNPSILQRWLKQTTQPRYLHATDDLLAELKCK